MSLYTMCAADELVLGIIDDDFLLLCSEAGGLKDQMQAITKQEWSPRFDCRLRGGSE